MSPVYLNPQHSSSIPFLELKGSDQQHSLPTIMNYVHDHVTSTNSTYFSGSNLGYHHAATNFLGMDYSRCTQDKVVEKLILSHDHKPIVYPFDNIQDQGNHNNLEVIKTSQNPQKRKPPKLKIIQKASLNTAKSKKITGDHHDRHLVQPKQSNICGKSTKEANNNGIRMCSDCHTTTTPLWRSGPHGPKSLCNACGIRQRKARKAAAAAMAATQAGLPPKDIIPLPSPMSSSTTSTTTFETTTPPPKLIVEENMSIMSSKLKLDHDKISHTLPLKKRCKTFNSSWSYNNINNNNNSNDNNTSQNNNSHNEENNSFEEFAMSSRIKNYNNFNSSQRIFSRDEEEGALLLMALSCGLACFS